MSSLFTSNLTSVNRQQSLSNHRRKRNVDSIDDTLINDKLGKSSSSMNHKRLRLANIDENFIERNNITYNNKIVSLYQQQNISTMMMSNIDENYENMNENEYDVDTIEDENGHDMSYALSDSTLESPESFGLISLSSMSSSSSGDVYSSREVSHRNEPTPRSVRRPVILSDYYSFQRPLYELAHTNQNATILQSSISTRGIETTQVALETTLNMEVVDSEPIQRDAFCSTCLSSFSSDNQQLQQEAKSHPQQIKYSKQPKACNFCMKSYCEDTCLLPCDMCSEYFCRNCSTPNHHISHGGIFCIECSNL